MGADLAAEVRVSGDECKRRGDEVIEVKRRRRRRRRRSLPLSRVMLRRWLVLAGPLLAPWADKENAGVIYTGGDIRDCRYSDPQHPHTHTHTHTHTHIYT